MAEPAASRTSVPSIGELLPLCAFPPAGTTVACAVSGGADSLALLALACGAGCDVTAIHVDHGLRVGSQDEALIVQAAAERFGARFRAERVEIVDGANLEARCREARRSVLGPDALTGHTADDQAETVLINLLRGTGVTGLGAMAPGPPHPLLGLRRWQTQGLCRLLGLVVIDDPSNQDPRFVRNRIRHELLPLMASISDRDPVPLINRMADHARAADAALHTFTAGVDPTDTLALRSVAPAVRSMVLRRWLTDAGGYPPSTAEMARVLEVVEGRAVACQLRGGRRVARTRGVLRIDGWAGETAGYDHLG